MSEAEELVQRLIKEARSGHTLNWQRAREDIHKAHDAARTQADAARTQADRVLGLGLHKLIMDAVERQGIIEEDELADFRETRNTTYFS